MSSFLLFLKAKNLWSDFLTTVAMQDYNDIAKKNNVVLLKEGKCQFCGANTSRGVHECVELFSLGFSVLDFGKATNYRYRFLSVDAHTLQHSEIHGRWNNHFHLTRLHLMLVHNVNWSYSFSPLLSNCLKAYKRTHSNEVLAAPEVLLRGHLTTTDVLYNSQNEEACKRKIEEWATAVHKVWSQYHSVVDAIAVRFITEYRHVLRFNQNKQ